MLTRRMKEAELTNGGDVEIFVSICPDLLLAISQHKVSKIHPLDTKFHIFFLLLLLFNLDGQIKMQVGRSFFLFFTFFAFWGVGEVVGR